MNGGLGLAIEEVMGAELKWYSEFDPAPSKIMAAHWPDAPNHGDMTQIDWAAVEPVDIISGGTPCQDLSHAGRRAGMTEGTRSNLWVQMREAIATIKPTYVVWENVRGAYSAGADSDLEPCPRCVGDPANGGPVLRALGRVLGDLSDLGYDCSWRGLRAADVGAPHGRFRVFILATHSGRIRGNEAIEHDGSGAQAGNRASLPDQPDSDAMRAGSERVPAIQDADCPTCGQRWQPAPGQTESGRSWADTSRRSGALAADTSSSRPSGREDGGTSGSNASQNGRGSAEPKRDGGERVGSASDAISGGRDGRARTPGREALERTTPQGPSQGNSDGINWGPYAPAIRRWEAVRGAAPAPTELTSKGKHRLSARFAEWMMGLPAGWVTDMDISRNEHLKALGNGVVPQQAAAALADMLNHATKGKP